MKIGKSLMIFCIATVFAGVAVTQSLRAEEGAAAEFGGDCVMGLVLGKDIKTDCSVSTDYKGRTYCFGNETAKTLFLKRPGDFLLQAHVYYSSREETETGGAGAED
ncbi:MAG: hypothetical protein AAF405_00025 [Pseudomonadota bacterium]